MRVLIIGAGNAGQNLAERLYAERHDVVLIDKRPEQLADVQAELDILTMEGEGASPRILEEAEIDKADLLVAVTDSDEVNILSCMIAHSAGVPRKVARVSNLDYLTSTKNFDLHKLGIDLVVSQKEEAAHEVFNILRMPGTIEAVDVFGGRILAAGIKVHMDSPLLVGSLKAFPNPDILRNIRFIACMRGEELIVPRGDTQFLIGDEIYFVGRPDDVNHFLKWAWPEHSMYDKVIIAGGGDLGIQLAALLERTPMQVVLLEQDPERANYCSTVLDKTLVMKGNALDAETLENAGIVDETAFVATTGSDENNIIACLVAGKVGARFTIAQVTNPEYVPIVDNLSLTDRTVSPPLSMINAILHFIRGKYVKAAALFHKLPGELLDVVIPAGGIWANTQIKNLKMPEGVLIAGVLRDEEVMVATGDLKLAVGDHLVVFALPQSVNKLLSLFQR